MKIIAFDQRKNELLFRDDYGIDSDLSARCWIWTLLLLAAWFQLLSCCRISTCIFGGNRQCGHIECNRLVLVDHEFHPDYAWEWKVWQSSFISCKTATQSKSEIEILDFQIITVYIFWCNLFLSADVFKVNTLVIHSIDQSNCIQIHSNLESPDRPGIDHSARIKTEF